MTTKTTALTEVVEAAEKAGWIVNQHPVTRFGTFGIRNRAYTYHDDIVVEIVPSQDMVKAAQRLGDARTIIALFRESGAFHTAFRSDVCVATIEQGAEVRTQTQVAWYEAKGVHDAEYIARLKESYKARNRYSILASGRSLTKTTLLADIEVNPVVLAEIRKENDAKRAAAQREQKIARLTEKVIPDNEQIVAQATEDAQEHLATIKDAVRATHPLFDQAPGLLDSVVLAVLGTGNLDNPAVAFIHARARIEQAQVEIDTARAFLAQEEVSA